MQVLQALQLAETWKLVQAGKVKQDVYDKLMALHGHSMSPAPASLSSQPDDHSEGPNPASAAFKQAQELNEIAQKHHQNIMIDWKRGYVLGFAAMIMAANPI